MSVRCARCKSICLYFNMVLWNGPRGFRRYPVCDPCQDKIAAEKPKTKSRRRVVHPGGLAL
jgi:hypothetical protein